MIRRPPRSTLFPYRRSSDLPSSTGFTSGQSLYADSERSAFRSFQGSRCGSERRSLGVGVQTDRKSTRLNSSHVEISYAVFCLKKKTHSKADYAYMLHWLFPI